MRLKLGLLEVFEPEEESEDETARPPGWIARQGDGVHAGRPASVLCGWTACGREIGNRNSIGQEALLTCDAVTVPVESSPVARIARTEWGRAGGARRGAVLVVRSGLIALLGFHSPGRGRWSQSGCSGHSGHRPLCRRRYLHNLLRSCRLQVRPGEGFLNGGLGRDRDLLRRTG